MTHTEAQTYYILYNFPQQIIEDFKLLWIKMSKQPGIEVNPGNMWKYKIPKSEDIYNYFPKADLIEFYSMSPGFVNSPHLDRGRYSALNIPIENNPPYTSFFIGKYFWLGHYTKRERKMPYYDKSNEIGPTGVYEYEKEKYYHNDFVNPLVFSTKIPHGGTNKRNKFMRILATVSFRDLTYEQLLNDLNPEWF